MLLPYHFYLPEIRLFLYFLCVYCLVTVYLRSTCWRDPSSVFFQAERAHVPDYSTVRVDQATGYIDDIASISTVTKHGPHTPPTLCVGVASVQRDGISYLKSTIGSLQHGLSQQEREAVYFTVLLAHTDQSRHQDFGEPWLANAADKLSSYHDDPERLKLARAFEKNKTHAPKSKFDYSVVLEECVKTDAPYILMLEDDIVALDGWYHRTMDALDHVAAKTKESGHQSFLYLRLFYYEALLGWNSESWPTYLFYSAAVAFSFLCALLLLRNRTGPTKTHGVGVLGSNISTAVHGALQRPMTILLLLGVCTPMSIGLFFAAGRNCMLPIRDGTRPMDRYACCGQALVFPRATAAGVVLPALRAAGSSEVPTDSFIERLVDGGGDDDGVLSSPRRQQQQQQQTPLLRWALTPVVMQHVGGRSSHGIVRNQYGDMTANRIFNFGFETNDPQALAEEHRMVLQGM